MNARTQRAREVDAILDAQDATMADETVADVIERVTGLDSRSAEDLMCEVIYDARRQDRMVPAAFAYCLGLDLGFRLGLEAAAAMPRFDHVVERQEDARHPDAVTRVRHAALAAGRHIRGWRP